MTCCCWLTHDSHWKQPPHDLFKYVSWPDFIFQYWKVKTANLRTWACYFPIKYIFPSSFLSQFPFHGTISIVQENWLMLRKFRWKKSFTNCSPGVILNFCQLGNHLYSQCVRACMVSDLHLFPFCGNMSGIKTNTEQNY